MLKYHGVSLKLSIMPSPILIAKYYELLGAHDRNDWRIMASNPLIGDGT